MYHRLLVLLVTAVLVGPTAAQTLEGYHSYEALTGELRQFVSEHPSLAQMRTIGTSAESREIWLVEVGNRSGTPLDERPGLLVAANLEGNQVVGSELVLESIRYLLENASDDAVRERLDNQVFYFLPRLNPDGAEHMFQRLQTGTRTNVTPYDDDNDARMDEDGFEDLNGDGIITVMRVPDPNGDYLADPDEPRLMKEADATKGEAGAYAIYWEGLDDDNDGFYNDDPVGGVDLNRNFQHEYPYYAAGSGIHMVSEYESRGLVDFVVSQRNIAMMLVFGESDNLVTAPNDKGELGPARGINLWSFANASNEGAREVGNFQTQQVTFFGGFGQAPQQRSNGGGGRRPATTVNRSDLAYFKTVSEKYREITGLESVPAIRKPEGAFFQYGYYQYGVPSFTTPGWAPVVEPDTTETSEGGRGSRRGSGGGSVDATLLKWMDATGVDGFVDWTPFDHPDLGEVEIGGFKPYHATNPPHTVVQELGRKQGEFIAHLASLFADVRVAKTEVADEGGGIFRIKAEVENAGFLPTATAHGVRSRSVRPTMVQLGIEPDDLLSGSAKTSFFQATDGSGRRQSFEWIIRGNRGDEVELRVVSQKGGSDTATLTLR